MNDAWAHLKAISYDSGAKVLLAHCSVPTDAEGVTKPGKPFLTNAAKRFFDREPEVRDLA